jgi:hypothetical protein
MCDNGVDDKCPCCGEWTQRAGDGRPGLSLAVDELAALRPIFLSVFRALFFLAKCLT